MKRNWSFAVAVLGRRDWDVLELFKLVTGIVLLSLGVEMSEAIDARFLAVDFRSSLTA